MGSCTQMMWIDSDVAFNPDDIERLRAHQQPFVCGIYAKKSKPEFASPAGPIHANGNRSARCEETRCSGIKASRRKPFM